MADNPRGEPVRSRDLTRKFQESFARVAGAEETVGEVESSIRQTQLAVQARRQQKPQGQASSAEDGILYEEAEAGPGGNRVGPFVTAQRLSTNSVFYEVPEGTGAIRALREGSVWARATENQQQTFEARVEPSRLMRYNELLVPHIAGKVSLRLHHDQGSGSYGPFERSRLIRIPDARRFNGRVEITSQSRSTVAGEYVHCLGGLELRRSDWTSQWELQTTIEAPADGTIELKDLIAHPGGQSLSFTVETAGGTSLTKTESVSKGDELVLRASGLDPTTAASLAKVKYDYSIE